MEGGYLGCKLRARVPRHVLMAVKDCVLDDDRERFDNISHFVRVAVVKELRRLGYLRGEK